MPTQLQQPAFLFDLDGVLVDTAKFHFQAWRRLARQLGGELDEQKNELLKGVSRKESLSKILEWSGLEISDQEFRKCMDQKNDWYLELVSSMAPTDSLSGAKQFLEASKSAGVKTALGSSSKNARLIIAKLGIDQYLDAVVDGNDVERSKPDPEVFLKGAQALNVSSASCVVFEDAAAGIEAAKRAGMKTVGIGSKRQLPDADMVVSSLADINVEQALKMI